MQIIVGTKICEKTFVGGSLKEAYKKAIKWVAKNILNNKELDDSKLEYVKESKTTLIVKVYTTIDGQEVKKRHCSICKEFSKNFIMNTETDCKTCHSAGVFNRTKEMISAKSNYTTNIFEGESK